MRRAVLLAVLFSLVLASPAAAGFAPGDVVTVNDRTGVVQTASEDSTGEYVTVKLDPTPTPTATATPEPTPTATPTATPTPIPTPIPNPEPVPAEPGIAAGANLPGRTDADLGRLLDEMVRAGAKWVRFDVSWDTVQAGGAFSYNWSAYDRVVNFIFARGMEPHLILAYTPAWARPSNCTGSNKCAPADPHTFATFAQKAAEHYGPLGVDVYEVWNEPNIQSFWQPSPNVANYTAMLKLAYPAIKAAQPGARVLTGGTAPSNNTDSAHISPVNFLTGVYANGGKGFFDAVAHHPYSWPSLPCDNTKDTAWTQMDVDTASQNGSLRSVMTDNGDASKRIWITEVGAPTGGSGSITESAQATMVTQAFSCAKGKPWAGPLEWYSHRDLGTSTSTRENFFGLLRFDWTQKPAFGAYQASHP